jgi:hypothetical protein
LCIQVNTVGKKPVTPKPFVLKPLRTPAPVQAPVTPIPEPVTPIPTPVPPFTARPIEAKPLRDFLTGIVPSTPEPVQAPVTPIPPPVTPIPDNTISVNPVAPISLRDFLAGLRPQTLATPAQAPLLRQETIQTTPRTTTTRYK